VISGAALTLAVLVVAAVGGATGLLAVTTLRARRRDAQILGLLGTFGPVVERALQDPRVLLAWHPIAEEARRSFPEAFAAIDPSGTDRFPFSARQLEAAHARWSADWLAWERHHDAEYRQKIEAISNPSGQSGGAESRLSQTRLESLEREKLERYQQRYEEYVQVSRALAALTDARGGRDQGAADSS
jgi:hypothetical protein